VLALSLALSIFCGLIFFLVLPLRLEVIYKYEKEKNGLLNVRFNYGGRCYNYFWEPFPYSFFIPSMNPFSHQDQVRKGISAQETPPGGTLIISPPPRAYKVLTWILRLWKELLLKTQCSYFSWVIEVGTGDPALTALTSGLLWNVATLFYHNLRTRTYLKLSKPDIKILPCFSGVCYRTKLHCIFIFYPGHIITAGIRTLIR